MSTQVVNPIYIEGLKEANPKSALQHKVGPETKFIQSCKGFKLHCYYWKPTGKPRGLVFLCHGFCEHLLWYEDLALRLSSIGLLTFGHDHVGHGRSEGIRGHVSTVDEYTVDVVAHCDAVKDRFEGRLGCFLVGHSLGGMVGIRAATSSPSTFSGVVLMGPLIEANPVDATPFKRCLAKLVSSMLPLMSVGKLNLDNVTRDEEMKKKMNKDPLRYHGGIRARFANACLDEMFLLQQSVDSITWPFLLLHGIDDRICSPEASKMFYKNAKSNDKEIKMYPDAYHHLFLEIPEVRKEALQDTVDWIDNRLPKPETIPQ